MLGASWRSWQCTESVSAAASGSSSAAAGVGALEHSPLEMHATEAVWLVGGGDDLLS